MMNLFGKKAQKELERARDEAVARLAGLTAEVEELRARIEEERAARAKVEARAEELEAEIEAAMSARGKAEDAREKAERMTRWLEQKLEKATREAEAGAREAESLRARVAELESELERERDRTDAEEVKHEARDTAGAGGTAGAGDTAAAEPKDARLDPDELERLRAENERLRRRSAELNERLKVALRKAEHNRRAYLVTQMQLDLAEDRIHLLTKGKPRPVLGKGRAAVPEAPEGDAGTGGGEGFQAGETPPGGEQETG